jgi:cystathionine beta-lyase
LLKANEWFWRNGFFDFVSGKEDSVNFLEKVRVFTLAESLGVESLANHPLMTHASYQKTKEKKQELQTI